MQLLQRVMFIDSSEEAMSSLVQPMMALLESRDATSKVNKNSCFVCSYFKGGCWICCSICSFLSIKNS